MIEILLLAVLIAIGWAAFFIHSAINDLKKQLGHTHNVFLEELQKRR